MSLGKWNILTRFLPCYNPDSSPFHTSAKPKNLLSPEVNNEALAEPWGSCWGKFHSFVIYQCMHIKTVYLSQATKKWGCICGPNKGYLAFRKSLPDLFLFLSLAYANLYILVQTLLLLLYKSLFSHDLHFQRFCIYSGKDKYTKMIISHCNARTFIK